MEEIQHTTPAGPPPIPKEKKQRGPLFWVVVLGSAFISLCVAGVLLLIVVIAAARAWMPGNDGIETKAGKYSEVTVEGEGYNKIAVISIDGVITDKPSQELFHRSPSIVKVVTKQLDQAAKDKRVKAVILEINSPGGWITATDVLHNEIGQFRKKTGKKIIAHMKDVAASGGYYLAASADKIIAHPTTITGSIGVIMMFLNIEGLFKKIGVTEQTIKSGEFKDIGSSSRKMTEEEEKLLREIVMEMYGRFIDIVCEGRKMARENVQALSDGRIYTGRQALDNGLVDSLGYFDDAVALAKKEAGISKAKIIRYRRKVSFSELVFSLSSAAARPTALIDTEALSSKRTPSLMYLWVPGHGR